MLYKLISVKTSDNLILHGLLTEKSSKNILINIHGTASNFYEEEFIQTFSEELPKSGFSVLSMNNRGAYSYEPYQKTGASTEKFESCILDIDAWLSFAIKSKYENIILSGHSLGAEKVVYYISKGRYKNKIKALILLAPSDSSGYLYKNDKSVKNNLEKERQLIKNNKSNFLSNHYIYSGIIPKSAESFENFLNPNSELSKALPFSKRKLENYSKIKIPILAVIGDKKEYTVIPIKQALNLLKKENTLTETHQLKNCNHDFEGKEKELTKIVKEFLIKHFK